MKLLWLIGVAMLMFTGGVIVVIAAKDTTEHVLGAVAILGALAVVVANVDREDR